MSLKVSVIYITKIHAKDLFHFIPKLPSGGFDVLSEMYHGTPGILIPGTQFVGQITELSICLQSLMWIRRYLSPRFITNVSQPL